MNEKVFDNTLVSICFQILYYIDIVVIRTKNIPIVLEQDTKVC